MYDVAVSWWLIAWRRGIDRPNFILWAARNRVSRRTIWRSVLVRGRVWLCVSRIIVGSVVIIVGLICVHDDLFGLVLIVVFGRKLDMMSAMTGDKAAEAHVPVVKGTTRKNALQRWQKGRVIWNTGQKVR